MTKSGKLSSTAIHVGVRGVELQAQHGVYAEERKRGSRFVIDVDAEGRWDAAVESDDLRDTLDVDAILRSITGVSQRRRYHLIESFAGAIADDMLKEWPSVLEVRVRVRKLAFPEWGRDACAFAVVTKRRAPSPS